MSSRASGILLFSPLFLYKATNAVLSYNGIFNNASIVSSISSYILFNLSGKSIFSLDDKFAFFCIYASAIIYDPLDEIFEKYFAILHCVINQS